MLCFFSLVFILSIVAAFEGESITLGQAIWCEIYGLLMFYHTSKKYWTKE